MELDVEIAEFVGALLGDGCLSKYWSNSENRWRYEIAFTGSNSEFAYYKDFIQPVVQRSFFLKGRLFVRKDDLTVRYHIRSKKLFDFLQSYGIPSGVKGSNLIIPPEFLLSDSLAMACARGVWNTDGSIFRRYNKKHKNHSRLYSEYLVMQLKMFSEKLLLQMKEILASNGINTTRVFMSENCYVLKICEQKSIKKYLQVIGFSNPHHLNRLKHLVPGNDLKPFC